MLSGSQPPLSTYLESNGMCRNGIKLARKIAGTKAMQRVTSREMHPGANLQVSHHYEAKHQEDVRSSFYLSLYARSAHQFLTVLVHDTSLNAMQSDDELDNYIRTTLHSGNALVGTCALGLAPEKGAVVDADLKVYGVKGLRVADSSVIPHIPGKQPHCNFEALNIIWESFLKFWDFGS